MTVDRWGLIDMHIVTMPDVTPIAAHPYPLALKHHDFIKQEIQNLLDLGIIWKSMSPWTSPIVVVKKHTLEGSPQLFDCALTTGNLTHCYQLSPLQQVP